MLSSLALCIISAVALFDTHALNLFQNKWDWSVAQDINNALVIALLTTLIFRFFRPFFECEKRRNFKLQLSEVRYICVVALCIISLTHALTITASVRYKNTQCATLFIGILIGQISGLLLETNPDTAKKIIITFLTLLMVQLTLTALISTEVTKYFYHGKPRFVGSFGDPNTFGTLMAVGITISIGTFFYLKTFYQKHQSCFILIAIIPIFFGMMLIGLFSSFSRGAWVGAICGIGYLIVRLAKYNKAAHGRGFRINAISSIIGIISILTFFYFTQPDWSLADRAYSVVNLNDFSWRNRVAVWEGSLQMMADRSLFGFGWGQPEIIYQHYYLLPKSTEGASIETNDYLLLGAALGIPAFLCFGSYIWLSLNRKSQIRSFDLESLKTDWLRIICQSGAIVLLVGFWFDGGLFKLPTAATFWILLELGGS